MDTAEGKLTDRELVMLSRNCNSVVINDLVSEILQLRAVVDERDRYVKWWQEQRDLKIQAVDRIQNALRLIRFSEPSDDIDAIYRALKGQ